MSKAMDTAVSDSLAPLGPDARSPRASGFVTHGAGRGGTPVGVEDAIRQANVDLERRGADHLTLPLAILVEQRDEAYQQLHLERVGWQTQHKTMIGNHAAELGERETALENLRQQLRDAERELASLREDPKTVIGVGPVSTRMATLQAQDSGEHRLQTSLESAWQDVQDLRSRLAQAELERDDAIREADDLRIEVYSKLATVRDEAIDLEARLVESQRNLGDKEEAWAAERSRLLADNEELRQALHAQVQANIELRRAIASGLPGAFVPTEPQIQISHLTAQNSRIASMPPVQTSAGLFDAGAEQAFTAGALGAPAEADLWKSPLSADRRLGVPEAAPAPSLASLVGFDTSAPDAADAAIEAASALDQELQEVNRRSRGFGLSRLFQRTK